MPIPLIKKINQAKSYVEQKCSLFPQVGIITGTGLGQTTDLFQPEKEFMYSEIPYMPQSTVETHNSKLLIGKINNTPVMIFQGRFHLYEGYSPQEVTFPIRLLQAFKASSVIITNASGGICPDFRPGNIMVIKDHINLTGENPLIGPNDTSLGERFPDMYQPYNEALRKKIASISEKEKISLVQGVYAGLKGPSLETPSEIRFLKTIGAEAVGFSTVMETIAAIHAGMDVVGLSVITNVHHPDDPKPSDVSEIIQVAQSVAPDLNRLISLFIDLLYRT
ncbi:Inosine guanosine and xanthosine phosphorylase [Candidatus Magnetomorum sp. HK-1]|nr:Inosine guanosine and xanthosine phosphorylase [Candidatus Magnetomorum sp. HK-1]